MAEYYPLLAKAVSSLPNSSPDTRRIVYERARKALIGQLRTMHPPVPDEDIERESVALDKAIERIEGELAAAPPSTPPPNMPPPSTPPKTDEKPTPPPSEAKKPSKPALPPATTGAVVKRPPPPPPLRPRVPKPKDAPSGEAAPPGDAKPGAEITPVVASPVVVSPVVARPVVGSPVVATGVAPKPPESKTPEPKTPEPKTPEPKTPEPKTPEPVEPKSIDVAPVAPEPVVVGGDKAKPGAGENGAKPRLDTQRPIAPQPPAAKGAKPRIWIIPAGIVVVVALVAAAAWKLRDRPDTLARNKPVEQTQGDTGKLADRVGGAGENAPEPPAAPNPDTTTAPEKPEQAEKPQAAAPQPETPPAQPAPAQTTPPQPAPAEPQSAPAATNPEVPVGYRAALLVEAPDEPDKVKTYLGTVVWKLNNVNGGPGDAVGLAVEADIDIPTDGVKVVVTIEKNADASLPASHVIKVRFMVQPGSATGDVKRLSVPQMRREDVQTGVPLAGVSVPVLQNSFLVGLTPGNSESANLKLLGDLEWIDIPMLLSSGKIAKLTFDKGASGQRDIAEALAAWQKQ